VEQVKGELAAWAAKVKEVQQVSSPPVRRLTDPGRFCSEISGRLVPGKAGISQQAAELFCSCDKLTQVRNPKSSTLHPKSHTLNPTP
jgi:hypothetical protein